MEDAIFRKLEIKFLNCWLGQFVPDTIFIAPFSIPLLFSPRVSQLHKFFVFAEWSLVYFLLVSPQKCVLMAINHSSSIINTFFCPLRGNCHDVFFLVAFKQPLPQLVLFLLRPDELLPNSKRPRGRASQIMKRVPANLRVDVAVSSMQLGPGLFK